ncbi:hypothetical protein [Microseira wollei]|nr:hypothetical protein [Microseira wollei]
MQRIPIICQGDLLKQSRSFVLQNAYHIISGRLPIIRSWDTA